MGELEDLVGMVQYLREVDNPLVAVVDPQRLGHLLRRATLDPDARRAQQQRLDGVDVVGVAGCFSVQFLAVASSV